MIQKLKRKKKVGFCTVDIETNKEGELIEGAIYDGKNNPYFFKTWNDFLNLLEENNDKKEYRNLFAHNGGNFDWIHFIEDQMDNIDNMEIVLSGSTVVFIQLLQFEKPVILGDTFLVLLAGLKKLCTLFDVETPKEDIDINRIEEIYLEDPETFYKYLASDVISLYQVMCKFMELLELKHWPLTAASLAMYIFRERFLGDKKVFKSSFDYDGKKKVDNIDPFITESYAGGRVECFRSGKHKRVKTFDINSLYPFVMKYALIPTCTPIKTKGFRFDCMGFYKCTFEQDNKSIPPILWEKGENGLEFKYKGSGVFCSTEIKLAMKYKVKIKIEEGVFYPKSENIFKDYVDHFYKLRMANKGTALDYICKILLNSLYGKFAERATGGKLIQCNFEELKKRVDKGESLTPYIYEKGWFQLTETREVRNRMVHVSSIITSGARAYLYENMVRHCNSLIYCDTDSIHLKDDELHNSIVGVELGQFKIEECGTGVYLGRKQYIIANKKKFKGVTFKNGLCPDNVAQIMTLKDYENLANGDTLKFKFHSFPKLKTVLKGKKACKIISIEKNLKKAKYTSNFS